jgi:Bacterial TSP3 repeat
MTAAWKRFSMAVLLMQGCADPQSGACSVGQDADLDGIADVDETQADTDRDGIANDHDLDSDADGIPDVSEARSAPCEPPVDSDFDGVPDFLDIDSNDDGLPDGDEEPGDLDADGTPDAIDPDLDGDGISNRTECCGDVDGDGARDSRDLDSDGDSILDRDEGALDPDGDGFGNFRDLDSDGDTTPDGIEAGDSDTSTPPATCSNEVDIATGQSTDDGLPDFEDVDRDNDGLSDGEEEALGTDPCDPDSDGDLESDLVEAAYARVNCIRGDEPACRCALEPTCSVPATDYFVVLPYLGPPELRALEFRTNVGRADVLILTDSTASMSRAIQLVAQSLTDRDGLVDQLRAGGTDAWLGVARYTDLPLEPTGSEGDVPYELLAPLAPLGSAAASDSLSSLTARGGGDGVSSATEALYQAVSGEGGTWASGLESGSYQLAPAQCSQGWGGACFRPDAMPIVVHFLDACSHNGPPGESAECPHYDPDVILPTPHSYQQFIEQARANGMKYIGVNAGTTSCTNVPASGQLPCYFIRSTALATGSVDELGQPFAFDLPTAANRRLLVRQIADALEGLTTRLPLDVDTSLRDDPSDAEGVDARRFVHSREPGCLATPPLSPCWAPPPDRPDVGPPIFDASSFKRVYPGSTVTFQVEFLPQTTQSRVFVAIIEVRGDRGAVLDERQVYVVVPAARGELQ